MRFRSPNVAPLPVGVRPKSGDDRGLNDPYIPPRLRAGALARRTGEHAGKIEPEDFWQFHTPIVTVPRPR